MAGLLTEISGSVPVVVVLDDFHRADGQSVALLKHVARAAEQSAVQLIVTYRESDLGKDHPLTGLLADLHQVPGVDRIALGGLGVDEVAQILTAAAGHELDEDGVELAGEIAAETGGNRSLSARCCAACSSRAGCYMTRRRGAAASIARPRSGCRRAYERGSSAASASG